MNRLKKVLRNPLSGGLAGSNHRGSTHSSSDRSNRLQGDSAEVSSANGNYDPDFSESFSNDDTEWDNRSNRSSGRRGKQTRSRSVRARLSSSVSLASPGRGRRKPFSSSKSARGFVSSSQSVASPRQSWRSSSQSRRRSSSQPRSRSPRSHSQPRSRSPRSQSQPRSRSPRTPARPSPRKNKKERNNGAYSIPLNDKLRALDNQRAPASPSDDKSITARTTGGVFRGKHKDVQTRLEALALERSSSPRTHRKKKKTRSTSKDTHDKRLRKGRRSGTESEEGTNPPERGRRSPSEKPTRTVSAPAMEDLDTISTFGSNETLKSDKKKKKKRHTTSEISPLELNELRELRDKRDKEAAKKKKKKRAKSDGALEDGSLSTMESGDIGSAANDSIDTVGKKSKKDKKKRNKSRIDSDGFPSSIPERGDPDGSKASIKNPFDDSETSSINPFDDSVPLGVSRAVGSQESPKAGKQGEIEAGLLAFEAAWGGGSNHKETAISKPPPSTSDDQTKSDAKDFVQQATPAHKRQTTGDSATAEAAKSAVATADGSNRDEVLKLQKQLQDALEKVLVMSQEQIQDKDQFLKASAELTRTKAELAEALEERGEMFDEVKKRDADLEESKTRIGKLEEAIERQLDTQDALEVKLERSEDEIEKLLVEMQEMETRISNGETGEGGGASLIELRETKKAVEAKNDEIERLKFKIEELEKELKDSMTVPQLQIDELDQENKALQGRLKGERLEANAKLATKEETIKNLQRQLDDYQGTSDAQDLMSARTKLNEARADATTVREDLETAKNMIEEMQSEREDLMERNNLLTENVKVLEKTVKELSEKTDMLSGKVLDWTEKTYDWKSKADSLERKLEAYKDDDTASGVGDSEYSDDVVEEAPQGLLLQAAMDKSEAKTKKKWGIFGKETKDQDLTAEEIRIKTLEERNESLTEAMAELRSEMVRMQTAHKEELYNARKKIARLEGENDALALQNTTLEKLAQNQSEDEDEA